MFSLLVVCGLLVVVCGVCWFVWVCLVFVGYLFWWFLFCCGFFGAVGFGFCVVVDVGCLVVGLVLVVVVSM